MKLLISASFLLLIFSGCTEKQSVLYINNIGLCSKPMATLYLNDIDVQNSSKSFNIAPDEIRSALTGALQDTNCFNVFSAKKGSDSLESKDEYLVNAKVNLYQEKETVEKNIFKKEEKERIGMMILLYASNNGNKVNASAKSELSAEQSKILGFKNEKDSSGDGQTILKNATKKVSISLTDGFAKLQK